MTRRLNIHDLREMKEKGQKITMITSYDYTSAKILDDVGADILLVGDSLAMVVMGQEGTINVTLDSMIHHARAVSRGAKRAMIVVDLPFGTYSGSDLPSSLRTATRAMVEGRATAVKIEGGRRMAPVVGTLVASGIPVMGHVGLTPQSIHLIGGFRVQGRSQVAAKRLMLAAKALEEAGAFAIVLELVPTELARKISNELTIPTIGIGAGPYCDGQVQVFHDVMGMYEDFVPKHTKRYADIAQVMRKAAKDYLKEVRTGKFPGPEHSLDMRSVIKQKNAGGRRKI